MSNTDTPNDNDNRPAVWGPVQRQVRPGAEAPGWWKCATHGPGTVHAWGCPECVREMRGEIERLRSALRLIRGQRSDEYARDIFEARAIAGGALGPNDSLSGL